MKQDSNVVIRTAPWLDSMVEHLGYTSVDRSSYQSQGLITDRQLVRASQERLRHVKAIPANSLDFQSRVHLKLARALVKKTFPATVVQAAIIPAASDRVRTAGMYRTSTGDIYIALEMLREARMMLDTLIHELGHHRQFTMTGEASDLTPSHAESMKRIADDVVRIVSSGELDEFLREVAW